MLHYKDLTDWLSKLEEDILNQNHEHFEMHSDELLQLLDRANRAQRFLDKESMKSAINPKPTMWFMLARHVRGARSNIRRGDFSIALKSLQQTRHDFDQKPVDMGTAPTSVSEVIRDAPAMRTTVTKGE